MGEVRKRASLEQRDHAGFHSTMFTIGSRTEDRTISRIDVHSESIAQAVYAKFTCGRARLSEHGGGDRRRAGVGLGYCAWARGTSGVS